jgi:hypothetical protein
VHATCPNLLSYPSNIWRGAYIIELLMQFYSSLLLRPSEFQTFSQYPLLPVLKDETSEIYTHTKARKAVVIHILIFTLLDGRHNILTE